MIQGAEFDRLHPGGYVGLLLRERPRVGMVTSVRGDLVHLRMEDNDDVELVERSEFEEFRVRMFTAQDYLLVGSRLTAAKEYAETLGQS